MTRWTLLVLAAVGCSTEPMPLPSSPLEARVALIRAVHPAPTRTLSSEELDEAVADNRVEQGTLLEQARALRRVTTRLGDAHIAVGLPPPAEDDASFLPLRIARVGDHYLVDAAQGLPVGDEVVAVEGVPIEALMMRLAELSAVDGDRPAVRLAEAERRFVEHARLELGARETWSITTRSADGAEVTRLVAGVTTAGLAALKRQSAAAWGDPDPMPTVTHHGDFTVLRLSTFGHRDRVAYLDTIAAIAPDFAAAERLVVDLRGNEGGDRTLGVAVARHLLDEPFTQWRRVKTRVRTLPAPFAEHVEFVFGANVDALESFPGEATDEGWVFTGEPLADLMVPAEPSYRGPLFLFVDDATNSAAIELAVALLAHHDDVTVVGRETQGECGWHVGQLPILFDDQRGPPLLMSLFEIDLVATPGCQPGRGIQPDLRVELTREDFVTGRDPFLRALE